MVSGAVLGLVAGGVVPTDLPLAIELLVGLAVVAVGVLGPPGSVLLAGLLLGAGLLTFAILLLAAEPASVSSALGVATLLIAGGAALSIRKLFRHRLGPAGQAPAASTANRDE